jgi:hypothetical protein
MNRKRERQKQTGKRNNMNRKRERKTKTNWENK